MLFRIMISTNEKTSKTICGARRTLGFVFCLEYINILLIDCCFILNFLSLFGQVYATNILSQVQVTKCFVRLRQQRYLVSFWPKNTRLCLGNKSVWLGLGNKNILVNWYIFGIDNKYVWLGLGNKLLGQVQETKILGQGQATKMFG